MYVPTQHDLENPCVKCNKYYDRKKIMLACDHCKKNWIHLLCAGLQRTPKKSEHYLCDVCLDLDIEPIDKASEIEHLIKNPSDPVLEQPLEDRVKGLETIIEEQRRMLSEMARSLDTKTEKVKSLEKELKSTKTSSKSKKKIPEQKPENSEKQNKPIEEIHSKPSTSKKAESSKESPKKDQEEMNSLVQKIMEMSKRIADLEEKKTKQPEPEDDEESSIETSDNDSTWTLPSESSESEDGSISDFSGSVRLQQRTNQSNVIALKQTLRDLPHFDGTAIQWPRFYSAYRESHRQVYWTPVEDLSRFTKALSGDAEKEVRGLMMNPKNVKKIIRTLKEAFGDNEDVMDQLKEEIRKSKPPTETQPDTVCQYSRKVKNLMSYVEALPDNEFYLNDPGLVREFAKRMSPGLQAKWIEVKDGRKKKQSLKYFSRWLSKTAEVYREIKRNTARSDPHDPRKHERKSQLHFHQERRDGDQRRERERHDDGRKPHNTAKPKCLFCDGEHLIEKCENFLKLRRSVKFVELKKRRACFTCLRKFHSWKKCKKNENEKEPVLHPILQKSERENEDSDGSFAGVSISLSHYNQPKTLYFRIVPVIIYGPNGQMKTYAILDDCSSVTLIEEFVCEELDLQVTDQRAPLKLQWTQNKKSDLKCDKVSFKISGTDQFNKQFKMKNVYKIPGLNLPRQSQDISRLKTIYHYLKDADLKDLNGIRPTILIGLEHTKLGAPLKIKEGGFSDPIAYKTRLGWTLHGPESHGDAESEHHTLLICDCGATDEDMHEMVQKSFTTEAFGTKPPGPTLESIQEAHARDTLQKFVRKVGERYEAPLLWKDELIELPDSLGMAKKRLICLENKLGKNQDVAKHYGEKIAEYVTKGYAKKLNRAELRRPSKNVWYLPHFPVINDNKPGKIRIVFDAAAKVGDKSLNSMLLKGPEIYTELPLILLAHRAFEFAVCADIAEMFHQVAIRQEDQAAQRFLWRECDNSREPDVYQMQRMTFGATSSPCTAQWVKNLNAEVYKVEFPEAFESIVKYHYVDDFLQSFPTRQEAVKVTKEVVRVHLNGGFELRKFISNCQEIQRELNGEESKAGLVNLNREKTETTQKILGMHWDTETDEYIFYANYLEKIKLKPGEIPTKRQFLRLLMSLFDPFGLLANFVVHGKILLQDVWVSKIGWDKKLLQPEANKFWKWIGEFDCIKNFRLSRCLSTKIPLADDIQCHTFSDASESAFAAVVYLRVRRGESVEVCLMGAKTRVAPAKRTLSIPRLELQGFLLGCRWTKYLLSGLEKVKINRVYHWTDSKNVIAWLESDSRKYKKFVELRISEALEYFDDQKIVETRYVPTKQNPADLGTKWVEPIDVSPTSFWVNGPEFLKKEESQWPENPTKVESVEEIRVTLLHATRQEVNEWNFLEFENFSSYRKLWRTTAWLFKWKRLWQRKKSGLEMRDMTLLNADDLKMARSALIQKAQYECYAEELLTLECGKEVDKSSSIFKLNPIIIDGVLRVGGRLKAADCLSLDQRHPIILKKNHVFTNLLLQEYHRKFAHQHLETCVNEVRQKYWITDLRMCIKKAKQSCQDCKNREARPRMPQMGNLPAARVTPFNPPFTFCGMDLFGPVNVKIGRTTQKRWIVLYTCLTSRAVHLEIVDSLSTDACIMAFRNFIAIRPKPREIYCDNGSNFVGMCRELKNAWKEWMKNKASIEEKTFQATHSHQTQWFWNPPLSPHMGGAWERLVRTVKNVFKRLLINQSLKEFTLRNLMMEAMDIVNSRPLTYRPIEHGLAPALTPNMLLKFSTCNEPAPGQFEPSDLYGRKQWRIVQHLADQFWRRWLKEALPDLTRRSKWFQRTEPLKVDDIVIIVDSTQERNCWERGRVVRVYPDASNQVRFADVKTARGLYKRPAVKLAPLDIAGPAEQD